MELTAVFQHDGEWIVAWLEELPNVMTQGATIEEARENLRDAFQEMIASYREQPAAEDDPVAPILRREPFSIGA